MLKEIHVQKLQEDAKPLVRAEESIGYDIFSYEDKTLLPGDHAAIKTELAVEFDLEYGAFIWDRSSMGSKNIKALGFQIEDGLVTRNAGCIEGSYRGEWRVILVNLGKTPYEIKKGHKVAQVVFQKVELPEVKQVAILPPSKRGTNGFGSTGL